MRLKIKSFSFRSPLSLALLLLLLLPACAGGQEEDDSLRIGVTLYDQDDTFISSMSQNLEQLVQEEESRIGQKITLFISDSRHNQTTQMDHVDRFLARGCDVPVFNRQPVDEDIQRWEKSFYVGASAQESGTLEGQLVAEAWTSEPERWDDNGDGILQYVMLEGEPGHQDALLRTEYTIQTITDQGIEVERLARDTANWNRAQAAARIASWLEEFGDQIEVVLSNNDDMALGAIDALKETGRPLKDWPLIVGIDATAPALEAVEAGQLYGTVFNDSRGQAQAILDLAMALCHGEDPAGAVELVDGHYVWLPYQLVTRENLALFQQGGG